MMTITTKMNDILTIRQMCDTFDVTPRTLRFYEAKELLFPIRAGTRRLFTRRDRARMTLISRCKTFGFSLENIRQILDVYDRTRDEKAQMRAAMVVALDRLAEMEKEHADLELRIAELRSEITRGQEMLQGSRKDAPVLVHG
jgi:DNA-binding transcriptional MerR regulator